MTGDSILPELWMVDADGSHLWVFTLTDGQTLCVSRKRDRLDRRFVALQLRGRGSRDDHDDAIPWFGADDACRPLLKLRGGPRYVGGQGPVGAASRPVFGDEARSQGNSSWAAPRSQGHTAGRRLLAQQCPQDPRAAHPVGGGPGPMSARSSEYRVSLY